MTEREIFLAAIDLPDAAARARYLDAVCAGDPVRRARIELLFKAHETAGNFLVRPAVSSPTPDMLNTADLSNFRPAIDDASDAKTDLGFLGPAQRPDALGRLGHYEILEVLGQGAFGIVFRAFDDMLQRVVAIKALAPQIAVTSPARKRFLREARSSAQIRHENVVQVYAVEEQPLPYLVMEYIPGESLQQRLDRTGPLEAPEIVAIGRQIAEGLAAAHASHLIHRDIKPGNVLIENGRVKITDFGLARTADDASLTQSGVLAGTPMYMAPEQAQGEALDHRADLFSLGSVLYVMATGRPPFRAASTFAVLKRVVEETPRPIREVIPEVPRWLCDIIGRLHAKKREDRFQTAREVADTFAEWEARLKANAGSGEFPRGAAGARPAPPDPSPRRSRRTMWFAGGVLVLLPLIALAATEFAGITRVFRPLSVDPEPVAKADPTQDVKPAPIVVVSPELITRLPDIVLVALDHVPGSFLRPAEIRSEAGTTLTLQGDDSILASGVVAARDTYTLAFAGLPPKIASLRLEVLPHDTLPNRGPGRNDGEFALTTIRLLLEAPGKEPRALKLGKAWADNSRGEDSRVHYAIDAQTVTGWVTEVGKAHHAVFDLTQPADVPKGATLRVVLEFQHPDGHGQLGRFRLSLPGPEDDRWASAFVVQQIAALPAVEQVAVVKKELQKRNPKFSGKINHRLSGERVEGLSLEGPGLIDLTPIRALTGLRELDLFCPDVADLSPLRGLELSRLSLYHTSVSDLSPLRAMKLTALDVSASMKIEDLSPLRGMPLALVTLYAAPVKDLGPLQGPKLTHLNCQATRVTDLSPLQAMPALQSLSLADCKVTDLSPLKGLRLASLAIQNSPVADLSPLKDVSLKHLHLDARIADPTPLRQIKDLERINDKSATEFLAALDARLSPDRRAAEYVLSVGGSVQIDDQDKELKADLPLPAGPFRLTAVRMEKCKEVSDEGLAVFKDCAHVTDLALMHMPIGDAGIAHFKNCKNLIKLGLHGTQVGDAALSQFRDCKNLRDLNLGATRVTDAGLANFKDFKNLAVLHLWSTKTGDAGLANFRECKNLTHLNLADTRVTAAGLVPFHDCKKIEWLVLNSLPVNDAAVAPFKSCPGLRWLELSNTQVTAVLVDEMKAAHPKCRIAWNGGVIPP